MKFKTTSQAYLRALQDVWFEPQFKCAPRGMPIREILNYTFTITDPDSSSIQTHDIDRNLIIDQYSKREFELYNSGSNNVDDFAKASKFWTQLANPDGTINSAYGYLIWNNRSHGNEFEGTTRTPWEWCLESLKQDKDTRQAILRFSLPEHQWMGNKDQTCTMYGIFFIRNDKLHLSVFMRSNDLMKGLVYDLPWFVSLMDRMIVDLRSIYPELTKGEYTHCSNSMHIYEKDEKAILKMLGTSL